MRTLAVICVHALVGWAFCGALMGAGMWLMSEKSALILHALGAPPAFALIARFYFREFAFTSPLATAVLFLSVVIVLDIAIVALLIERSFAMFASPLGTWIPFVSIFFAVYTIGRLAQTRPRAGPL